MCLYINLLEPWLQGEWTPHYNKKCQLEKEKNMIFTLFRNSSRSSAVFFISPVREFWTSFAISFTVSWRNFAYSILALSRRFSCSYNWKDFHEQQFAQIVQSKHWICMHHVPFMRSFYLGLSKSIIKERPHGQSYYFANTIVTKSFPMQCIFCYRGKN